MRVIFILFFILIHSLLSAQPNLINVTENTLRIPGHEESIFYYGFAEGDQLIFNFQEINNKKLKEVEIIGYPSNSRYMEYKTSKIENKIIRVSKTGIYEFRLHNSGWFGRVCKIRIDRIPASDGTRNFNTAVKWINRADTTWNSYTKNVVTGYDTVVTYKTRKELVKSEISEDPFMTKDERVHSQANPNGSITSICFTIPTYPSGQYITKKANALAYWVGVGDAASRQWEGNIESIKGLAKSAVSLFVSPLGAYALGAVADLALPGVGEDVYYALVDEQNKNLFLAGQKFQDYDHGKGIAGYQKFTNPNLLKGTWFIVLRNDNYIQGINVNIRLSVIVQTDYYEEKTYPEKSVKPYYENRVFKKPLITFKNVPVIME